MATAERPIRRARSFYITVGAIALLSFGGVLVMPYCLPSDAQSGIAFMLGWPLIPLTLCAIAVAWFCDVRRAGYHVTGSAVGGMAAVAIHADWSSGWFTFMWFLCGQALLATLLGMGLGVLAGALWRFVFPRAAGDQSGGT